MGLLNDNILYRQYSSDKVKIPPPPPRSFQEEVANKLLCYNEEEWHDSGNRIPHARSQPVDKRYDGPPVVAPASPFAMPGLSSARPGPSSATPGPSSATPSMSSDSHAVHASFSEEDAAGDPGVPQSTDAPEVPQSTDAFGVP